MVPIDSKSSQYVNNSELCLLFPAFFHQGFSLSIPQGALRETLKAVTIKFYFTNDEFLDRIDFYSWEHLPSIPDQTTFLKLMKANSVYKNLMIHFKFNEMI